MLFDVVDDPDLTMMNITEWRSKRADPETTQATATWFATERSRARRVTFARECPGHLNVCEEKTPAVKPGCELGGIIHPGEGRPQKCHPRKMPVKLATFGH
jgi:hypothetical protein